MASPGAPFFEERVLPEPAWMAPKELKSTFPDLDFDNHHYQLLKPFDREVGNPNLFQEPRVDLRWYEPEFHFDDRFIPAPTVWDSMERVKENVVLREEVAEANFIARHGPFVAQVPGFNLNP